MARASSGVLQWRAMAVQPTTAPAERRGAGACVRPKSGRGLPARLAATLLGLALPLLLAEVGLRWLVPGVGAPRLPLRYDVESIEQVASGTAQLSYQPDSGWIPTPDFDRTSGDVRYQYNHAGLRAEREYASAPSPGIRRILAYG